MEGREKWDIGDEGLFVSRSSGGVVCLIPHFGMDTPDAR